MKQIKKEIIIPPKCVSEKRNDEYVVGWNECIDKIHKNIELAKDKCGLSRDIVCPICNGSGCVEEPSLLKKEWNYITKKAAKVLLNKGFSIRQTAKLLGFGSTATILKIKNER